MKAANRGLLFVSRQSFDLALKWSRLLGPESLMGDRAVFDTAATPGAAIHVDTSGALFDFDLKIARRTFHRFQVCIGDQFNV